MLKPVLEKIATDYEGKFILAKADTEKNSEQANKYDGFRVMINKEKKDGKVIDEFVGAQPEATIKEFLDSKL